MKTIEDFDRLELEDKVFLIFDSGYEMATHVEQNVVLKMYALYDFFVEVRYLAKDNKIESIITINADDMLRRYSGQIDISDVFKK